MQLESSGDVCYESSIEDAIRVAKYKHLYEELSWVNAYEDLISSTEDMPHLENGRKDIFSSLKFLEAILSGDYLDYLCLYAQKSAYRYLDFSEFQKMHRKINTFISLSVFTKNEFRDVLFYGIILAAIEGSTEFKDRAWVYGTSSLFNVILMHIEILPTLKRFSKEQKNFLGVIIKGFQFSGYLEEEHAFLTENIEYFDLSYFMFICRMAMSYRG